MVFITNAEVIQGDLIHHLREELEARKSPGPEPGRPAAVESYEVDDDLDMINISCTDGSSMVILIKTAFKFPQLQSVEDENLA